MPATADFSTECDSTAVDTEPATWCSWLKGTSARRFLPALVETGVVEREANRQRHRDGARAAIEAGASVRALRKSCAIFAYAFLGAGVSFRKGKAERFRTGPEAGSESDERTWSRERPLPFTTLSSR
jgi:hypothetical protein